MQFQERLPVVARPSSDGNGQSVFPTRQPHSQSFDNPSFQIIKNSHEFTAFAPPGVAGIGPVISGSASCLSHLFRFSGSVKQSANGK